MPRVGRSSTNSTSRRRRGAGAAGLGSVALVLVMVGALLAVGAPAWSTNVTSCTYNDTVGLVTVDIGVNDSVTVNRDGDVIEMNGAACTDGVTEATVSNTEVINIVGSAGNETATLSLLTGRFAPGRSDEPGGSDEIEIFVYLSDGTDRLELLGRDKRDAFVFGTQGGQTRVNLNATEGDTVDYDLSIDVNVESFVAFGSGGNDTLLATGGAGTGTILHRSIRLVGMGGHDTLIGGKGSDVLDDRKGTGDRDVLRGKGGNDQLLTRDGDGLDRAIGGPGDDTCRVDTKDAAKAC